MLYNNETLTLIAYKVFTISQNRDNFDMYIYNSCNVNEKIN